MKNNSKILGAFVVGGTLLTALSAVLLGGSEFFAERDHFIAYFEEDTNGLNKGASVLLNGVRIGFVSDIDLVMDASTFEAVSQVTLELLPDSFLVANKGRVLGRGSVLGSIDYDKLVYEVGARAQLATQSLITGQMVVNLELRPDTEVRLHGGNTPYPEIPTVPSNVSAVLGSLLSWINDFTTSSDGEELANQLESTIEGISALVNSSKLHQSLAGFDAFVNSEEFQAIDETLIQTLLSLDTAAQEIGALTKSLAVELPTLTQSSRSSLLQLEETLSSASESLTELQRTMSAENPPGKGIHRTLRELEGAARAAREFFFMLEQKPEALLRGK